MAYFDNDMDTAQMPVIDRMDTEYTIYVNSLPVELNEAAIRDIFGQYGEITGMFYPRNATWTYITYGTYREAELAIRELNNKKPLYLKVALAKERSTKEEQKSNASEAFERSKMGNTADSPPIHNDLKYQNIGRGQSMNALRKHVMPQMTTPHRHADKSLPSLPSVPQPLDSHEVEDPYANTNKLWTRGVITVTPDGKRHVSLGRGYTLYEYPEPYPKIEERISKVYEQRNNGLYEYSEDKLKSGVQNCSVCFTKTIKHCEKCHTYYCSKACQLEDWPQHQAECERIPALVEEPIDAMSSLQINQDVNQTKKTSISVINKTVKSNDVKLRRPNTTNAAQVESSHNMNINMHKDNTDMYNSMNNGVQDTHSSNQQEFSQQRRLCNYNKPNETNQSSKNSECSPTFSSIDQTHNHQSDSNRAIDRSPQRNSFQNDRENTKEHGQGTSTSYNTSMANDLTVYKDTHLSSHTIESTSNNTVKTLVPQENYKVSSNRSTKASTVQIPSILDALADLLTQKTVSELRIEGYIQICESMQKNVYSATLSPEVYNTEIEMIFNDLQDECSKAEVVAGYKPKAEELVCGECSDGWYRGYVLVYPETSSNFSIIKIDEARIQSVDKILPCPKKYLNICALGVICKINHSAIELQEGNVYEFRAIMNMESHKQESLKIEIIIDSEPIEAVIKPWKFPTNSSNPLSHLKNGSKICLTSYRNHHYMFARSLDEEQVEYYNTIMQSVARYAQTASHLTEPPVPQQVVIAPFEDGNSYRALVLKTENDKAKIVYIDFGNVDEVDIKDLKVMPRCHSLQQSCTAKLILKDVPHETSSNQEVDLYIRNLLGKEVPLICTYDGTSPMDGVVLTIPLTGECVNDTINQLLIPQWKKENNGDNDNTCYMLRDIDVASLGRVGDTVNAVVLFVRKDNQTTYMMGPWDVELVTHIFDVMPAMLTEYCEKMEYYIPRAEELCLALYDGAWYRAACLEPKDTHTTAQILFIDYGNIESVEHKNIRLMPKEFITPVALASLCTVVNLASVDNDGNYSKAVQKKIDELVVLNSTIKIKIVECFENGDYKIELPDVRDALIEHGLV